MFVDKLSRAMSSRTVRRYSQNNHNFVYFSLLCIAFTSVCQCAALPDEQVYCQHYTDQPCKPGNNCTKAPTETCRKLFAGRKSFCFVSWTNNSGKVDLKAKGCWYSSGEDCDQQYSCVASNPTPHSGIHFCCCEGSMCNEKYEYKPVGLNETAKDTPDKDDTKPRKPLLPIICFAVAPVVALIIVVVLSCWLYRRHKAAYREAMPHPDAMTTPLIDELLENLIKPGTPPRGIQLLEVKAKGRFGCVWKAQLQTTGEHIAVKVFPPQDRLSFQAECDLYTLPGVSTSPNILQFIGVERHDEELWLITEFHNKGSLHDYLKSRLVSFPEALRLLDSMLQGLAFLHSDDPGAKPSVAHRDFKSKNVLVRSDLTACIADFGLALKFDHGKAIGDTHGQVGTRRYMAPEVLEGSITFNRDSFLRIDMYACGLVMWEILSRCSAASGCYDTYRMPYEDELGAYPTIPDLQDLIAIKKTRPVIKPSWTTKKELSLLACTITESWDHDPEARLTAECAQERVAGLFQDYMMQPSSDFPDPDHYPSDPETVSTTSEVIAERSTHSLSTGGKDSGQDTMRSFDTQPYQCPNVCVTEDGMNTPEIVRKPFPKVTPSSGYPTSDYSTSSSSRSQSSETHI